jgi:hypothetical protein
MQVDVFILIRLGLQTQANDTLTGAAGGLQCDICGWTR